MRHWLFKSEPSEWSWDDQVAKGSVGEEWDGVRNYQARNFMREMVVGDLGFFYHSQKENQSWASCRSVRPGILTAVPMMPGGSAWIYAPCAVAQPVTLESIKADQRLAEMPLVRSPRLSVQPVTPEQWNIICEMGKTDAQ